MGWRFCVPGSLGTMRRMRLPTLLSTLAMLLLLPAGCDKGGGTENPTPGDEKPGDRDLPRLTAITVEPADQVLVIDAGQTPASQAYRALGTFEGGETRDITADVRFSVDSLFIGGFSGSTFTTYKSQGGVTTVTAQAGSVRGSTRVSVKLQASVRDPASSTLPADAQARFSGPPSETARPEFVYPNDGTLMPPNVRGVELHFLPGTSNTLFELTLRNAVTHLTVYLRCTQPLNGGCVYRPDDATWLWLTQTNRGGEPVTLTLRGTDDSGSRVGTSASLSLAFANDDLAGGLYYWTTSNGTAIMRFDFTNAAQTAGERFIGPEAASSTIACIGCHALSRDGKKLIAEASGQNDGRLVLLDVGSKTLLAPFGTGAASPDKSIFESWNPDSSQYVGVYADSGATDFNLLLFNGTTGKKAGNIPGTGTSAQPTTHPDWSADGRKIAYVQMGVKGTNQRFGRGAIQLVQRTDAAWSAPVTLAPAVDGKNRYYPALAPDNAFLLFNESTCPSGVSGKDCNADSDPSARLFAVRTEAGAPLIDLQRANAPGKRDPGPQLTSSFPKWAPFTYQRTREPGSRLQWFTFSSTRRYGLRNPPAGGDENPNGTLLWIAAVDPDRVTLGQDPSYPALLLPLQDITTSNHIAQWTEEVIPVIR